MADVKKPGNAKIKLQIQIGKANPAPPVGSALGQKGVNIMEFCKAYNAVSQAKGCPPDWKLNVNVDVRPDRTFAMHISNAPATTFLLKQAASLTTGSSKPGIESAASSITYEQVMEIARLKQQDMNTESLDAAERMVRGTAKSIGLSISEPSSQKG